MKGLLPQNIKQLSKCFQEKKLNPIIITQQCLDIADKNANLNAFIRVTKDAALKSARNSERRHNQNKHISILDGAPISVKDNFCTNGIHTTCSSKMLQDFIPTYSATVYDKLEKEGAILIGKTNMDQFGMGSGTVDSLFGPTKNVWSSDLSSENWRIAGGSSGGSAISVALGICMAALGSDTGGSTRNPASYCGVVGLKPTYGLVSRHGLIPLVNSMDVPGILTRNIDDCAVILNALAGPDIFDSTTLNQPFSKFDLPEPERLSMKGIKIGIPLEYHCEGLSNEVLETWTKIADMLEDAGAEVKQVSLPNTAASIAVYSIINQCEVSSNMSRYDGIEYGHRSDEDSSTELLYAKTRAAGFNCVVKNRILAGNYFLLSNNYDRYFQKALKIRRLIASDFDKIFNGEDKVDFLLTPTTLSEAPLYKDFIKSNNRESCALQDFCTQPANMSGIPAISIPIRLSSNNLPLSLQLMGPHLSEKGLLSVAKWIEQEVEFPTVSQIS